MKIAENLDDALSNIIETINDRNTLTQNIIVNNRMDDDYALNKHVRDQGTYQKGDLRSGRRLIASLPTEVDRFFSKVYGREYYKDKQFFIKRHPEWRVVNI